MTSNFVGNYFSPTNRLEIVHKCYHHHQYHFALIRLNLLLVTVHSTKIAASVQPSKYFEKIIIVNVFHAVYQAESFNMTDTFQWIVGATSSNHRVSVFSIDVLKLHEFFSLQSGICGYPGAMSWRACLVRYNISLSNTKNILKHFLGRKKGTNLSNISVL